MPLSIYPSLGRDPICILNGIPNTVGEVKARMQIQLKVAAQEIALFAVDMPGEQELTDSRDIAPFKHTGLIYVPKQPPSAQPIPPEAAAAPPAEASSGEASATGDAVPVVAPAPAAAPENPPITLQEVQNVLKSANPSSIASIHHQLQRVPPEHLDRASIKEELQNSAEIVARTECILSQVTIIQESTRTEVKYINYGRFSLVPWNLSLADGMLEMRCQSELKFRNATPAYVAEVEAAGRKREEDIAHDQKLLVDLPIALQKSYDEMAKQAESAEQPNVGANLMNDLGAMVLEQKRIKKEIEYRKTHLAELLASPVPKLDPAKFTTYTRQSVAVLNFGYNLLAGEIYHLMRKVHPVVVTDIDPYEPPVVVEEKKSKSPVVLKGLDDDEDLSLFD